ncbi:unnamed protein product [Rhizophagus irregularis]|nr:unnamed protein product [Rhizophagus irregularis]
MKITEFVRRPREGRPIKVTLRCIDYTQILLLFYLVFFNTARNWCLVIVGEWYYLGCARPVFDKTKS